MLVIQFTLLCESFENFLNQLPLSNNDTRHHPSPLFLSLT